MHACVSVRDRHSLLDCKCCPCRLMEGEILHTACFECAVWLSSALRGSWRSARPMLQACRLKTCQARWADLSVLPSQTWSGVQCVLVLCLYGSALAVLLLLYSLCCVACCRNAGSRPAKQVGQFHQLHLLSLNVVVHKPLL